MQYLLYESILILCPFGKSLLNIKKVQFYLLIEVEDWLAMITESSEKILSSVIEIFIISVNIEDET